MLVRYGLDRGRGHIRGGASLKVGTRGSWEAIKRASGAAKVERVPEAQVVVKSGRA